MVKSNKRANIILSDAEPSTKKQKTSPKSKDDANKKTKNFVGKSKIDKAKQNNSGQLLEKPADWSKFKKERKELRLKRRKNKNFYDIIVEAKKIGENLRRKNLKGGDEERQTLTNKLHELLGKKDQYVKLVLAHDMARIVQYLLKFGSPQIREEIAKELIPSTVELIQSKYAKFCVERMLKYGNTQTRNGVIEAMYGSVVKLASHSVAAHVLANAYCTWANAQHKINLQQEFYGDIYKQNKDGNVRCIADVYKNSPEMKSAVLSSVKANLTRIFNKELLDNQLVHAVLNDYLSQINDVAQRNEIIALMANHAVVLANSKDGSRVVMQCIWHGTNKDKKTILKALKEHIKDLCCHEHAHTVIITVLDAVDDTVLVSKILLSEIITHSTDLVQNEWGRKVLLWLVAPSDPHHFHPIFINELKTGYDSGTSKKSPEIRRQELLKNSISTFLQHINNDISKWLANSSITMVTLAIIKADYKNEYLKQTLEKICDYICDENWIIIEKKEESDANEQIYGIEHPGYHMCLKKLAQHDKILSEHTENTFGAILFNKLTDSIISKWLMMNRGCFLLIALYESNSTEIRQKLVDLLKSHLTLIKAQNSAGAKILLKKIKEN